MPQKAANPRLGFAIAAAAVIGFAQRHFHPQQIAVATVDARIAAWN